MSLRLPPLVGLAFLCTTSSTLAESQQDLLDMALSSHRIARESIHTFFCQVSITSNAKKRLLLPRGEYWRSPDAIRIRSNRGSTVGDVLVQNSRIMSIVKEKTPRGDNVRASVAQGNQPLGECDVWRIGLLSFFGSQGTWVTLDEVLNGKHKLKEVKRLSEGGQELIYIDLEHEKARLEIWLDPKVNYLARKMHITMTLSGPKARGEHEVVRFKEAVPGIYFPEQVEARGYTDNNLDGTTMATFADIRINQPLQHDAFKLHYPSGVKVMDTIQGKFYTVDGDGRPVGTVKNMQVVQTPPLPVGVDPQTATEFEPTSATRWILPVSLGVLAMGGIAWLIRKQTGKRSIQKSA